MQELNHLNIVRYIECVKQVRASPMSATAAAAATVVYQHETAPAAATVVYQHETAPAAATVVYQHETAPAAATSGV
jgi:hypothetical protein